MKGTVVLEGDMKTLSIDQGDLIGGTLADEFGKRCMVGHLLAIGAGISDKDLLGKSSFAEDSLPEEFKWLVEPVIYTDDQNCTHSGSIMYLANDVNDTLVVAKNMDGELLGNINAGLRYINEMWGPHGWKVEIRGRVPDAVISPEPVSGTEIGEVG